MKNLGIFISILFSCNLLTAGNPIIKDFGMADPHAYVFNDKVYLFTTRDAVKDAKSFIMPDWHIWSSTDLINWKHERTIEPTETYMGQSNDCWATETVCKDGKYYFYFSNGNKNTGVMVSDKPEGPYKDILQKPLLSSDLTKGKEYDPTVWVEKNGDAYIIFGHYRNDDDNLNYYIARLNDDMVSLAESPKIIDIIGDKSVLDGNDKPNIHKHGGMYYLSAGMHYATSDNIYGPYIRRGNSGNNKHGMDSRAHGNYFQWNNQWFNTWCHFYLGKENGRFRESYITYLHYRENGEMVSDTVLMTKHFDTGVGSYSSNWDCIEAEWFMRASKETIKKENKDGGFCISGVSDGDYVYYPNISEMNDKRSLIINGHIFGSGIIELREDSLDGRLLGEYKIVDEINDNLSIPITPLYDNLNLYVVFRNVSSSSLINIDSFTFK